MKKRTKIILAVIALIVVVIAVILVQIGPSLHAIISMKPMETKEALPGVYAVKNSYVNLYLVESGGKYIAFDAGANPKATKTALSGFGIDESDVAAVFLTHTDYDHVAAIPLFSSAVVYMAESNKAFLEGESGRSKAFIGMGMPYQTLSDGEAINISGADIQCVFTPGHTGGSACYIVDGRYLFTGDAISLKNGKAELFVSVFNENDEEQARSIRKLAQLTGIEAVFTMHFGLAPDFDTAFSDWL